MEKNVFCVVSHTHWDREWYQPFEVFRLRLVDLIDRLLLILEKEPKFIFHLDAQTIVLEDYLEIRPEKKEILKKHIKNGNIIVGPWYLQNDFFLTSGEATVRNLLLGTKIAKEFGKCSGVGYTPDQFGLISQLPQILAGFGIDNCIFGRGYAKTEIVNGESVPVKRPAEFTWRGADGTGCTAVNLAMWYNNAQDITEDAEELKKLLDTNAEAFNELNATPYILLMNGVDHLEARGDLLQILEDFKAKYPQYDIAQVDQNDYIARVKRYVKEKGITLPVHNGELHDGGDYQMLKGCRSTRYYLKAENVQAQTMLENRLEPLFSMLELFGMKQSYPAAQLAYAWKQLLKNHPHDSICGCSNDHVPRHMEDNFLKIGEVCGELFKRGMALVARGAHPAYYDVNNYIIAVANTTQARACGVVTVQVDFRVEENVKGFKIVDQSGRPAEFRVLDRQIRMRDVYSPVKSPVKWDMDTYTVELFEEGIEPFSYKTYTVIADNGEETTPCTLLNDCPSLENEYYKITFEGGCADVFVKESGRTIPNAFRWEESGDHGDSYVYLNTFEPVIESDPLRAKIKKVHDTGLVQSVRVENVLTVPEKYLFDQGKRSGRLVECGVTFTVSLQKGSKNIRIDFEVDNHAKDHRIRFVVATDLAAEGIVTDSAFDAAEHRLDEIPADSHTRTFCNANFACIEDGHSGVAAFSCGAHEVEKIGGDMLFTIVRATGGISIIANKIDGGDDWTIPDNQLQRKITGMLGVRPYTGDFLSANISSECVLFKTGIAAYFTSMDDRKYGDCRFVGTDPEHLLVAKRFGEATKELSAEENVSAMLVENANIIVSAFKRAENGKGLIVRLFNMSPKRQKCGFSIGGEIYGTGLNEKNIKKLGNGRCELTFGPKQIRTLFIKQYEIGRVRR